MLRLKENPTEWIKFTAVIGFGVNLVSGMLWHKNVLPAAVPVATLGIALLAVIIAAWRPIWFRGFYRCGMTGSYLIGQVVGKTLLVLFFFVVITPMGLFLRLLGKDLLQLKLEPTSKSYWHTAKCSRNFDRLF